MNPPPTDSDLAPCTLGRATRRNGVILRSEQDDLRAARDGFLVRPVLGAPEWLTPFQPSFHQDLGTPRYRLRSCVAPCSAPASVVGPPQFRRFKTLKNIPTWLKEHCDWPYVMLYLIHHHYVLPSGKHYADPLGDQARARWHDDLTAICAGWKLINRL